MDGKDEVELWFGVFGHVQWKPIGLLIGGVMGFVEGIARLEVDQNQHEVRP